MNNESAFSSRGCQPALCASRVKIWHQFGDANRVFLTFPEMYSNVNTIWISRKNVVSLYSEEERARKHWVFSSFFWPKKRIFTLEIEFSTLLRKFFFGVCGKFFRNVGVRGGNSEAFLDVYL